MIYEIKMNNDFIAGASLHVVIPNEDLDKKALQTIAADRPDFILPFHHRSIDGQIEFIYQIGSRSKLQYLSGQRSLKDYVNIWAGVLDPLHNCGDWFMKPYSFVLSAEHLYCEKNSDRINYLYIPSIRACSGKSDLKEMAADITRLVTVTDPELENMVLRSIVKDFDPNDFMQMLKSYVATANPAPLLIHDLGQKAAPVDMDAKIDSFTVPAPAAVPLPTRDQPPAASSLPTRDRSGDIIINIPLPGQLAKKAGKEPKARQDQDVKDAVKSKDQERVGVLFGKKKKIEQGTPTVTGPAQETPTAYPSLATPLPPFGQDDPEPADICETTQNISVVHCASGFRLIGNTALPPFINVGIGQGEIFTVGRYDSAVGRQQSDFEFERKTKAVSRRHAVVERAENGYSIIDLSSSAGTFVDGNRLQPNTPCRLGNNCRVSFGNAGADYVWEG